MVSGELGELGATVTFGIKKVFSLTFTCSIGLKVSLVNSSSDSSSSQGLMGIRSIFYLSHGIAGLSCACSR